MRFKKIFRFCLSSFSSFIADYLLYSFLLKVLSDSALMILTANITARVISASLNYYLNSKLVFETGKSIRSASSYFILALFILIMNNIVLELLTQKFKINAYAAKLITECLLFILSWIVQSRVIFLSKTREDD